MTVDEVLNRYEGIFDVFVTEGFVELKNPLLRSTVAKVATLEKACTVKKKNLDEFLARLNDYVKERSRKANGAGDET